MQNPFISLGPPRSPNYLPNGAPLLPCRHGIGYWISIHIVYLTKVRSYALIRLREINQMATSVFDEPRYKDPEAARQYLESLRWPNGAVCPHCAGADRQAKIQGKSHG